MSRDGNNFLVVASSILCILFKLYVPNHSHPSGNIILNITWKLGRVPGGVASVPDQKHSVCTSASSYPESPDASRGHSSAPAPVAWGDCLRVSKKNDRRALQCVWSFLAWGLFFSANRQSLQERTLATCFWGGECSKEGGTGEWPPKMWLRGPQWDLGHPRQQLWLENPVPDGVEVRAQRVWDLWRAT